MADAQINGARIWYDVHGDGEVVLMMLRATGSAAYTGIEVNYEWAAIWTVRDGRFFAARAT